MVVVGTGGYWRWRAAAAMVTSRQIEESISILNFFPPKRSRFLF
jgi:hypothetical protein